MNALRLKRLSGVVVIGVVSITGCGSTSSSNGAGAGGSAATSTGAGGSAGTSTTATGGGMETTVSLTPKALAPEVEVPGPLRALEQWIEGWAVSFPSDGSPQVGNCFDDYMRFKWREIQDDAGNFQWNEFDAQIQKAIDARRKFHFAVIPMGTTGGNPTMVDGGKLTYPLFMHQKMQAEAVQDWIETVDNFWVIDWNSPSYLEAWEKLHLEISKHIAESSYKGIPYAKAIGLVEINGYGNWGEWHNYPWTDQEAPSRAMTGESAKRVIDANLNAYPDFQATILMDAFAGPVPGAVQDPAVGYYALTAKTTTYNGMTFGPIIAERWKYAPVNGEPAGGGTTVGGFSPYGALPMEVQHYHVTMLSNGNLEAPNDPTLIANVRAAAHLAGYRLVITGGQVAGTLSAGGKVDVRLDWQNRGVAPTYEDWTVKLELRDGGTAALWSGDSAFALRSFLPADMATSTTDGFTLPPSLSPGSYGLFVKVVDPTGYRDALPLALEGRTADGAYTLADVAIE